MLKTEVIRPLWNGVKNIQIIKLVALHHMLINLELFNFDNTN